MHFKNLCRILTFITAITVCIGRKSQTDRIKVSYFSTVPLHYRLNLILSNEKDEFDDVQTINNHKSVSFDGESKIIINILHPILLITLQKLYQRVISAKLITRNGITYEVKNYRYFHVSNLLEIYLSDTLLPGFYTMKMEFIGNATHEGYNVEGFFKNSHINKDGVTQ